CTLRVSPRLLISSLCLAGCASTGGVSPKIQTVASVGDRQLPVVTGEPGSSVRAETNVAGRRRTSEAKISGRVVDENGAPMSNVRVRLADGRSTGGKVVRATTDHTGTFTLHGIRAGSSYKVIAEYTDDHGDLTGSSEVQAPDSNVKISLAPV